MGVPTTTSTSSATSTVDGRLKREHFRRTKHDSVFSPWKILIGASDWEGHFTGKEGVEKYRTQNLPSWTSCPGVYELGIATSLSRKLDSSSVVPVYLGQAENLRTRLQQYGRDGAHLENGRSNDWFTNYLSHSPGLFTGVFSRGYPIVYRCAPMPSKRDAEITEKQLLDKFDYAWNKGSNGTRRLDDISRKLDSRAKASHISLLAKKLVFFPQKQVGIKIKTCESRRVENGSNLSDTDGTEIFSSIFGIRRLQPRPVQYGSCDHGTDICGVALGHGSICATPPVKGRKRCALHKGMRVNGCTAKVNSEGDLYGSCDHCIDICGVALGHGSICTTPPVKGRKRCALHKGIRVNGCTAKVNTEGKVMSTGIISDLASDDHCAGIQGQRFSRKTNQIYTSEQPAIENYAPICGVILDDGSTCKRNPFQRNKRCLEHKGRRISTSQLKFASEETEQTY